MAKTVLITGGSRGIGAATAQLAAQRGYTVCITYLHNQAAAEAVVADITAAGRHALAIAADVGVEHEVMRLFEHIDTHVGPITALVNNAGILEQQMRVDQMEAARLQRIFTTNVVGPFLCARGRAAHVNPLWRGRWGDRECVVGGRSPGRAR